MGAAECALRGWTAGSHGGGREGGQEIFIVPEFEIFQGIDGSWSCESGGGEEGEEEGEGGELHFELGGC